MKERTPLISVIMSVYNEEQYIKEAVMSILNQTLDDFELIIIDDCSTDNTGKIINDINDERVIYILNEENQGLTKNLNKALKMAKGKYIARMDGDDISDLNRFDIQVKFLNENPEIMLISCNTTTFGEESLVSDIHGSAEELKCRMLLRPVLAHPGFMFRRELFEEKGYFYDEHFRSAQDYDFAARVTRKYPIQVVPEVLLKYRAHKGQVSQTPNLKQFGYADEIRKRLLQEIGIELTDDEVEHYHKWVLEKDGDVEDFKECYRILLLIVKQNTQLMTKNETNTGNHYEKLDGNIGLNDSQYASKVLKNVLTEQFYIWMLRSNGKKHVFGICGMNPAKYMKLVTTGIKMYFSKKRRSRMKV